MKFLLILILTFIIISVGNGKSAFAYDDHGNRDPFWPLVSSSGSIVNYGNDVTASDMILEGIVSDAQTGSFVAIINGAIVKAGDTVGAYQIQGIEAHRVILVRGQEQFELNLKKGGEE